MAKGKSSNNIRKANDQRITAGYAVVTSGAVINQPSKEALRAATPVYDPTIVKKIPPGVKGIKKTPSPK